MVLGCFKKENKTKQKKRDNQQKKKQWKHLKTQAKLKTKNIRNPK